MGKSLQGCHLDQRQHRLGAKRTALEAVVRVEEGVDGGQAVAQLVEGRYRYQLSVQAHLQQSRVGLIEAQEGTVLLVTRWEHVTVMVARADIAGVEVVVAGVELRRHHLDGQVGIAPHQASLGAIGAKVRYRDSHGDAGVAAFTVRAVKMQTAATEAK